MKVNELFETASPDNAALAVEAEQQSAVKAVVADIENVLKLRDGEVTFGRINTANPSPYFASRGTSWFIQARIPVKLDRKDEGDVKFYVDMIAKLISSKLNVKFPVWQFRSATFMAYKKTMNYVIFSFRLPDVNGDINNEDT